MTEAEAVSRADSGICARCHGPREIQRTWCPACHELVVAGMHARERLPVGERSGEWEKVITATLHVWFIYIDETEEELARLRNESVEDSCGPATSKIERTVLAEITPINRVAARVVKD